MIIPTDEEFEKLKEEVGRTDWSFVYKALGEHGKLILPKEPKSIRTALSNYYRRGSRRARVTTLKDGRCMIFLEGR